MKSHCYTQSQVDHTVFFKHSYEGKITILIIYVDDTILTDDDSLEIERVACSGFWDQRLKNLKVFCWYGICKSKNGIFVSQRKYVLDLLKKTWLLGCKATKIPIDLT